MQELSLQTAVSHGVRELNSRGLAFNPHEIALSNDFQLLSPNYSGVIALPATGERAGKGYELVKFTKPNISEPDITWEELWECAKKHYGLTAAAGLMGLGGIPIEKMRLGHKTRWKASKNTNLISHYGFKFFPRATLPTGSPAARLAKARFGTVRIFGVIGRASLPIAFGLAVFDLASIGWCAYGALSEK